MTGFCGVGGVCSCLGCEESLFVLMCVLKGGREGEMEKREEVCASAGWSWWWSSGSNEGDEGKQELGR